jgi:putative transposase
LVNAIFYLVRTGCQWRNLPKDFAPWRTVYHYFRCWKHNGLWHQIHTHLREHLRSVSGRKPQPSAAIIDSQSVKSTEASDERGYDAGKKINGRKRHILVDTIGLVLLVMVLPANIQDRDGAKQLLAAFFSQKTRRRVKHIWADGGYTGTLLERARKLWRCTVEIVKRSELHTFKVLPRRWVVERTFGWLGRYRRLSRDYERQATTGETIVYLAMIRLMLARLGKP